MSMLHRADGKLRYAVFADSHGNKNGIRKTVLDYLPLDGILHLGDGVADGEITAAEFGIPYYGVAGNEDHFCSYPLKSIITVGDVRMMLLHGHQTDINPYQEDSIFEEHCTVLAGIARREGASILLFGHTHEPLMRQINGMPLFNPGGMYIGSSGGLTFGLIESYESMMVLSVKEIGKSGSYNTVSSLMFSVGTKPDDSRNVFDNV